MAEPVKKTVLYLFRNDLRVHDNQCLKWAQQHGDYLLPLYCFQPGHFAGTHHFKFDRCGIQRAKFLVQTVQDLRCNLKTLGSNLVIRKQCVVSALNDLIMLFSKSAAPVHTVVYQHEITSEETGQETEVSKLCAQHDIHMQRLWGSTLFHRDDIPYGVRDIPDTFTKFRQGVEARSRVRDIVPTPSRLNSLPPTPHGAKLGDIPKLTDLGFKTDDFESDPRCVLDFLGGETAGLQRLNDYLWTTDSIATYKETRNGLLGKNYSTKFSPWLANGSLSPRHIYHEVKRYEKSRTSNDSTYWSIFELIWRDYFHYVAMKYGKRIFFLSGIMRKEIPWKQDEEAFGRWKRGETGIPFVDANMRELLYTGWMSNRGRQNVASFLTKDLHLDWRMGAEWFESLLLDHDVCSNYGNWNYSAGVGNDPRQSRKFNIIKQALDYDADGKFVKQWLPELKDLPPARVHFPWTLSDYELERYNVKLGCDYPRPIMVAPEWNKFFTPTATKAKNLGQDRGVDFYFKSNSKK